MKKKVTREEAYSLFLEALTGAKTQEDLNRADDLADNFVAAGLLTSREVNAMWEDLAPDVLTD